MISRLQNQKWALSGLFLLLLVNYVRFLVLRDDFDYPGLSEIEGDLLLDPGTNSELPMCDIFPTAHVDYYEPVLKNVSENDLLLMPNEMGIELGGRWKPKSCSARHQVAVLVPLRGREDHLVSFLYHLHRFLQKQLLDYQIFVVEQKDRMSFNRGMLFNVGFREAEKRRGFGCYIMSDVDLIPTNAKNMYACTKNPRHLSVSIDTFRYVLTYGSIFGGVISMTGQQFRKINGFSNRFFGWGGEDDDLQNRLREKDLRPTRWPTQISRYTMLFHSKEDSNPNRYQLLDAGQTASAKDGLTSLRYKLLTVEELPLHTRFVVDLEPFVNNIS